MKESIRIAIIITAMIIGIASLFHYVFYNSWIGIIGFGIGLLIINLTGGIKTKEIQRKIRKMSDKEKKMNKFLKIFLYVLVIINLLASTWMFYQGNIKSGVFLLEVGIIIFISNWRMP